MSLRLLHGSKSLSTLLAMTHLPAITSHHNFRLAATASPNPPTPPVPPDPPPVPPDPPPEPRVTPAVPRSSSTCLFLASYENSTITRSRLCFMLHKPVAFSPDLHSRHPHPDPIFKCLHHHRFAFTPDLPAPSDSPSRAFLRLILLHRIQTESPPTTVPPYRCFSPEITSYSQAKILANSSAVDKIPTPARGWESSPNQGTLFLVWAPKLPLPLGHQSTLGLISLQLLKPIKFISKLGWGLLDSHSNCIAQGFPAHCFTSSDLMAEAIAFKTAISAAPFEIRHINVIFDSQSLVSLVNSFSDVNELRSALVDFRSLLETFSFILACFYFQLFLMYSYNY